jgi:hypothetical protein
MASLDSLNDGQRAVLKLLLLQGKSYDDIATLLRSEPGNIRTRARGAVAALGPDASDIGHERRDEIADYLLGQQTASQRAATRDYLESSADGRAWARSSAAALAPLGSDALPEIPAEREEVAEAFVALERRSAREEQVKKSSQLGTKLLLAGVGVVWTPTGDRFQVIAQGTLRPPQGVESGAKGQVAIVRFPDNNQFRFALQAEGLPRSSAKSAYGVWLYTSDTKKRFLGFPNTRVGADGKLQTVSDLSPDTPNYGAVLLTRETAEQPKKPGPVVLLARMVTAADQAQAQGRTQTQTQTTP